MKIKELTSEINNLQKLIDDLTGNLKNLKAKLAEEQKKEPVYERVKENDVYYYITCNGGKLCVTADCDNDDNFSNGCYNNNNYFHSHDRAAEVRDKIEFLLKLERLHDIYCPDYVPDLNNAEETKWYVFYCNNNKQYDYDWGNRCRTIIQVYFPTPEIAKKVCDILNAELKSE